MAYGLKTFKSDGTTVILQNSSKSGVFARTFTTTTSDFTSYNSSTGVYRKEFPEYNGRTIRVFQLNSNGNCIWNAGTTGSGLNVIEFEFLNPNFSLDNPNFTIGNAVLYIFLR